MGIPRHILWIAALSAVAAPVLACPEPSEQVLFHSCWGEAEVTSLLLPEDGPVPAGEARQLVVTGGYTGKDRRLETFPNPVGMFIHRGQVVNPTLARMDGVAIVDRDGALSIEYRRRVAFAGQTFDLNKLAARRAFQTAAAEAGASVFQSHLLIVDGALDIRPIENAPLALRRLLFTDGAGFGIYQTARPVTLSEAAAEAEAALAPRMALNLDMGSFDYCIASLAGVERNCGLLGREDTAKLSNLLLLRLKPSS
ncbi:MAG: hypothetical protein AAF908_01230 [Pseudomonadota bacterium]